MRLLVGTAIKNRASTVALLASMAVDQTQDHSVVTACAEDLSNTNEETNEDYELKDCMNSLKKQLNSENRQLREQV